MPNFVFVSQTYMLILSAPAHMPLLFIIALQLFWLDFFYFTIRFSLNKFKKNNIQIILAFFMIILKIIF